MFNKENRKCSLGKCYEIVITDVLYLRTKNIFLINIREWSGCFPQDQSKKRGIIVYLKILLNVFFDIKNIMKKNMS